jgi:molybdate transport system substrate-binding protein
VGTRLPIVLLAVIALLLAACSSGGGATSTPSVAPTEAPSVAPSDAPSAAAGAPLTIFAAASLAKVLEDVKAAYEAAVPGSPLTISTDSSAALATQIIEGAPADVFLSADTTNPQKLVDAGLVDGDPTVFAGNKLTIITPTDNPGGLTTPFDLGKDGVRVIAAGDEVPITKYATQLVEQLAAAPGAPADFAAAYAANIASKEDNVAAVRTKIELGEGDGAIVYVTDAAASDQVASIDVPDDVNVPASYAGVVIKSSTDAEAAHAFLDWLASAEGQAILATYGFLPPAA